eukprot:jgi/Chrpa1/23206/Chrysochromulina_OHIO_Genome00025996-RA
MVRELYAIPSAESSAAQVGSLRWRDSDHNVFMFRRLICVMMVTAFRLGDDPLQEGWVDRITPLAIGEIPAYLLQSLPDFTDTRLDDVSLSPILRPLVTDWYPLPPEQPSAPSGSPLCPKDAFELLLPAGAARLRAWFDHQLRDPTLENVMRDMAVLGRAASRWQTALYCSNGDIKDYFNHLAVATSELSKVGILLDRGP